MFWKKRKLTDAQRKWNLMWELWAQGKIASPYAELMLYDSEVNNGGHYQYFDNVANNEDLSAAVTKILAILPPLLRENLKKAYNAFLADGEEVDEEQEETYEECDDLFYENEKIILDILQGYANSLSL